MEHSKKSTLTKANIVDTINQKIGFSKKDSIDVVECVFESIKETLEKGEAVKISGFGKFEVKSKNSRIGRNPQTGQPMEISARRVLKFNSSQKLRDLLS